MKNTLFYVIKQYNNDSLNALDFITRHSYKKYGEHLNLSVFAYTTLLNAIKKVYGVSAYDLDLQFLESGKPTVNGFSVSVSHTNGVVAVAFLKGDKPVGIDIEVIADKKSERLNKLLNLENDVNVREQYLAFTKRESFIKAFDLNMLTKREIEFEGISKTVKIDGSEYALSVFYGGDIKEIKL